MANSGRVASPNRLSSTTEPASGFGPTGFDPARIKRHLLERYCDERCAEFGDVGCWAKAPDEGFCAECIDDTNLAMEFVGQAMAIEAATQSTGETA